MQVLYDEVRERRKQGAKAVLRGIQTWKIQRKSDRIDSHSSEISLSLLRVFPICRSSQEPTALVIPCFLFKVVYCESVVA